MAILETVTVPTSPAVNVISTFTVSSAATLKEFAVDIQPVPPSPVIVFVATIL
jgi:hypothetical protein